MGGWTIIQDGEQYSLPFDFEFPRSRLKTDMLDAVMVTFDERIFDRVLGDEAAWVTGGGPYLVLAYCRKLAITRHQTLESATKAERCIDSSGCGGCCVGVHLIGFSDPENGIAAEKKAVVRQYIKQHDLSVGSRPTHTARTPARVL
jgi:hypothetical protein